MDPLHQFQITPLVPITIAGADLSFTNSSLWMAIAVAAAYFLIMTGTRQHAMVPGRLQSVVELMYEFVAGITPRRHRQGGDAVLPARSSRSSSSS